MRSYVISVGTDDPCGPEVVVGVKSSRKAAIEACETALAQVAPGYELKRNYEKHKGTVGASYVYASYKMFLNNEMNLDGVNEIFSRDNEAFGA